MTNDAAAEVVVRAAAQDDAELVRTLVGELADHQSEGDAVGSDVPRWRELLDRDEVTVLIAEVGGQPAGYVSAVRRVHLWNGVDVIGLDDLYVRPAHRDLGVGRRLMEELARRADGLTIAWSVRSDNEGAIRFYRRLGATTRTKVLCSWTGHPSVGPRR